MRVLAAAVVLLLACAADAGVEAGQGGVGAAGTALPYDQVLKSKHARENRFDKIISEASRKYRIPAALIKAVIKRESYFDHQAVSRVGAQGLMQLMPATARRLGVRDPFDPRQNIFGGTRYLSELARLFKGDMISILASYNAGEDRVFARGYVPPFKETQNYVVRVLSAYVEYGGELSVRPKDLWRQTMDRMKAEKKEAK